MVVLRFSEGAATLAQVGLVTDLWKRQPPRPFVRDGDGWELVLDDLPVDRLEYELELVRADGSRERVLDPSAPTVEAPFGAKSVHVTDGYRYPVR